AADLIENSRAKILFNSQYLEHRRGSFCVLPVGISYGGGQQYAKQIYHHKVNCPIIEQLLGSKYNHHLAGHVSF
ncbi:hypothetical protein K435DRAFT_649086, partial [Dendrothele bispora CBS 962.96]